MKSLIICGFLMVMSYCASAQESNSIEGVWQLVKGEYKSEDSSFSYPQIPYFKSMKIITKTNFATVWQDTSLGADESGFNGGTYTFVNGIYTESCDYFFYIPWVGAKISYRIRFEGDRFLMSPVTADGKDEKFGVFEEWKRVEKL